MAGLSLWPVGLATVGGVLVWTGIYDPPGGPVEVGRQLLSGKLPAPGAQKKYKAEVPAWTDQRVVASNARGGQILAAALRYEGVPYRWGGNGMSGIDCSGVTQQAYKAVGISLPRTATPQTRRCRKISREQAQPGDLVAWGTPVRYPHIAIYAGGDRVFGAWTYGTPAGYGSASLKMHGGPPTFFRYVEPGATGFGNDRRDGNGTGGR